MSFFFSFSFLFGSFLQLLDSVFFFPFPSDIYIHTYGRRPAGQEKKTKAKAKKKKREEKNSDQEVQNSKQSNTYKCKKRPTVGCVSNRI